MIFRRVRFKIVLPTAYLLLTALFIFGIIITIAEGPNPFGFLFYIALYPSTPVLDLLLPDSLESDVNFWIALLVVVLINLAFYFLLGNLIDYLVRRRSTHT
jgi:cytochrome b561